MAPPAAADGMSAGGAPLARVGAGAASAFPLPPEAVLQPDAGGMSAVSGSVMPPPPPPPLTYHFQPLKTFDLDATDFDTRVRHQPERSPEPLPTVIFVFFLTWEHHRNQWNNQRRHQEDRG